MTREPSDRFAFVLGTGRCGSTLVHELLARHAGTAFVSNVTDKWPHHHVGGRWNGHLYRHAPLALTRKGRMRFAPSEAYRVLDEQVSPIISTPVRDLRADDVTSWLEHRFRKFFQTQAASQNGSVFLHKFTGWPRAGFIRRILPEANFIHVIRDGRAVANSWLQMPWWRGYQGPSAWHWGPLPEPYDAEWEASGRSFVVLAGLAWKLLIDAFEAARSETPAAQWMDVRYEDVVTDPRGQVQAMLDFIGLEWTEAFDRQFSRYQFRQDRGDAYRHDLDAASLSLLEESLASHLSRYGYRR